MSFTSFDRSGIISTNNLKVVPAMLSASGYVVKPVRRLGVSILTHKKCTRCGEVKPIGDFGKHGNSIRSCCRLCHSADQRSRYAKNPEEYRKRQNEKRAQDPESYRAINRAWRAANKDKVRKNKRKSEKKNPETTRARKQRWLSKNVDKMKELVRQWALRNPEKNQQKHHARRARLLGNGGVITAQEWKDLKAKYNYTCLCCLRREPEIKLTLDHVIPLFVGGSNTIDNAQPLCLSCNDRKGTKTIDYRGGR